MHLRRRFPPLPFTLIALLLALQSTPSTSQCIPLRGSSLCPRYQSLSINPGNLSSSWPFFDAVVDTTSFDVEFARYLTPGGQFAKTKQGTQLGCSGWDVGDSVLQYQRTFLCGEFTSISYSAACNINNTDLLTCQSTCVTYAASEALLVTNTTICPPNFPLRNATLVKDFTQCTDWTSLSTNNTATCIEGSTNEPNCGFAYSTEQLCAYCDPARELVNPCCALQTTDISLCGYTLSTNQILSTSTPSSSTSAIATSSTQSSSSVVVPTSAALSRSRQLSGGTIAGVVIGSVIGALLLVLLLLLWRRRRNRSTDHAGAYESAAGSTPSPSTAYVSEKVDLQQWGAVSSPVLATAIITGSPTSAETVRAEDTVQPTGPTLVSEWPDHYSAHMITPNSLVVAIYPYSPRLVDELQLKPPDAVKILSIYDDGWAQGLVRQHDGGSRIGAFPLVCVTTAPPSQRRSRASDMTGRSTGVESTYVTRDSVSPSERGSSLADSQSNSDGRRQRFESNTPGNYFPSPPTASSRAQEQPKT